jgi:DNA-3-methyladenine glycosylase II
MTAPALANAACDHLRKADPVLARIIQRVGPYRPRSTDASFHGLARSIVYQQLSGKAAGTIFGRLLAATSDPLTAAAVLRMSQDELRRIGLSQQKASYVRDLAERTARGEIDFSALPTLPDEEIVRELSAVKGVGLWTVQMYLIFALQRPDVLPVGDLGIRGAIKKAYRTRQLPKPDRIEKIARKWHPYCSVASWYLWRSLELADE